MDTAIEVRQEITLPVSVDTAVLIRSGVSNNTLKAYRHALAKFETWMHNGANGFRIDNQGNGGGDLNDSVLAEYITHLHQTGKSPATISQAVAAVKWRAKNAVAVKSMGWSGMTLPVSAPTRRRPRQRRGCATLP